MLKSANPDPGPQTVPGAVLHERRRGTRLEVMGSLHGQMVPLRIAIRVTEVGFGGFAIETVFPLPVGAEHDFRFTLRDGLMVQIRGRVAHCRHESRGMASVYIMGLEYVDAPVERRKKAATLVREVETTPSPKF